MKFLKNNLIELYNKIVLFPNYQNILNHYEEYFSEQFVTKMLDDFNQILKDKAIQIESEIKLLNNYTASFSLKKTLR